ncbi:MAG: ATP-binding protein [Bacteroidota bacterium]
MDSLLKNKAHHKFDSLMQKMDNLDNDSTIYWYYRGKSYLQKRELGKAVHTFDNVDTTKLSNNYKGWFLYELGNTYRYANQEEKAFSLKLQAQDYFDKAGNQKMTNAVNYDLHYTLVSQDFLEYDGESYLNDFFENAKRNNDIEQLLSAHLSLALLKISPEFLDEASYNLNLADKYAKLLGTPDASFKVNNYRAVYHQNFTSDLEKAAIHADSMLYYARILQVPNKIESSLKTIAYNHTLQGNYDLAITKLMEADKLPINENIYNRKRGLYQYLSLNYEYLKQIDSAFEYSKKMNKYKDSVNINSQNTILSLLQTTELQKQNFKLTSERDRSRYINFITIAGLIMVLILAIMVSMNLHKKRLLAERERELMEMDARNEEKDKQRQRIAGELHDDLGSLMVAIQHCFQNLKERKDRFLQEEEKLVSRAKILLDEAYQKIRNIAQIEDAASNNSEGLITSIENFADKISKNENLSVEVNHYGLDDSLDEIKQSDLRRFTIELIANAVKHAMAKEISVDITQRKRSINIIVEDNGKGFDIYVLDQNQGLGLRTIKRKIEKMGGEFTLESIEGKGTTIILEIPL